jgi:hypothetical protein
VHNKTFVGVKGDDKGKGDEEGFVEVISTKKKKKKGGKAFGVWPLLFRLLKISKTINKGVIAKKKR